MTETSNPSKNRHPFLTDTKTQNVAGFSFDCLDIDKQDKQFKQHSESRHQLPARVIKNDRTRQFAIHVKAEPCRPYDEYLILPPMTRADYLAAIDQGPVFRQWLIRELHGFTYDEILINGDMNDLRHSRPVGYSLKCKGWTGIGNECGCVVDQPGSNYNLIL